MTTPVLAMDGQRRLACPGCGEFNGLHVDQVELAGPTGRGLRLFDPGEDDTTVGVLAEDVEIEEEFRSSRRHSVVLSMSCELCGRNIRIAFVQHKGETFVRQHES